MENHKHPRIERRAHTISIIHELFIFVCDQKFIKNLDDDDSMQLTENICFVAVDVCSFLFRSSTLHTYLFYVVPYFHIFILFRFFVLTIQHFSTLY